MYQNCSLQQCAPDEEMEDEDDVDVWRIQTSLTLLIKLVG